MKVLLIDNNDSFTFNLLQLLRESGLCETVVIPYDEVTEQVIEKADRIIISPGPGIPDDFPNLERWILNFAAQKPFLGICLGLEAIAEAYGARLIQSGKVFHGITKSTRITAPDHPIFRGIPLNFRAGLYHSWILDEIHIPDCIEILARADDDIIMAIKHKKFNLTGLQFHPESIMTKHGSKMICNWLSE
ncbi:MAG: aminodeoxychorismate/anthranilate synthase component II [Bacteroidales bacterium]|nr:aminodeoxychorismate/anthranilate synthase component II [Bacteroidales bacterium]